MYWHRALGHASYSTMEKLKNGLVDGIAFEKTDESEIKNCTVCAEGKQNRLPFKERSRESNDILQLIHSDLMGPMENVSIGLSRYILTFIDDFTKKVFVYFLKNKSEVFNHFREFKALIENQTGKKIRIIRTDNGKEYVCKDFEEFCKRHGIMS